jgi:NADH-quinone oxidoreductase subunit H
MPLDVVLKALFIVAVVILGLAPVMTWTERKQSAVMQDRIGANRASIGGFTLIGLLHPLADVIKLLTKEDVVPAGANRVLHLLAPVIAAVPAVIAYGVIPFAGVYEIGGRTVSMVVANPDWGLLYIFAIGSIAIYGTVIAGWASNNNFSLLGSLRASAQMISYEVTMGLSVVGVFMVYGTLQLQDMVVAQDQTFRAFALLEPALGSLGILESVRLPAWGIFLQPVGFVMFLTTIMAENKRPPFDLPEGESEIVAGYHLEYSGMRFGLFYMAEFIEVVVIAGLLATLFLGGWSIPYVSTAAFVDFVAPHLGVGFATGLCVVLHFTAFMVKVSALIWLQMALRWTLPRFRYDHVMDLCWKVILPLSIVNIFVTGAAMLWIGAA